MCGIAGFVNIRNPDFKLEVLEALEIRGRDGFGYIGWLLNDDEKIADKTLETPTQYFSRFTNKEQLFYLTGSDILLANTRAVPTTEFQQGAGLNLNNQQPFETDRYQLVFNGLITNDKELIEKYDLKPSAPVDTAMLIPLFEKVGVVEGMKMLDGGFAIICFDRATDKFYFGRNFLPLTYNINWEYGDEAPSILVTSLREMAPKRFPMLDVKPYTCMECNLDDWGIAEHSLYRNTPNKKALVIFSGGIDSVVTAWLYKYLGYDLTLLHFKYGQAAMEVEDIAAHQLAYALNAPLLVHDARETFKPFSSARLLSTIRADENVQLEDAEGVLSYVPNRNAIFAMVAGAWAEKLNCSVVAYGGQQMSSAYPDNGVDFMNAVDTTLKFSLNWQTNIKFTSPIIHLIKHEIVRLGLMLGVPFDLVCSCYFPTLIDDSKDNCYICHNDPNFRKFCSRWHPQLIQVCGKCGCCQFRFSSFKMLGIKDTQMYKTLPSPDWFTGLKDKLDFTKEDLDSFIEKYLRMYV